MEKNDTEKFSGVMFFNKKIMQEMFGNELSLAAVGEIDAVEFLTAIKTVHFIMQNIVAEKMLSIVEVEQVEKEASAFDDYDRENGYEDEDEQPEERNLKITRLQASSSTPKRKTRYNCRSASILKCHRKKNKMQSPGSKHPQVP